MAWRETLDIGTLRCNEIQAKALKGGGDPLNGTAATEVFSDSDTVGTVRASSVVTVDNNKDVSGFRHVSVADSGSFKLGADGDVAITHDGTASVAVSITDDLAAALDIKQGSNSYLKFVTTDGSEKLAVGKLVQLDAAGGNAAANALLLGIGTSANPATTSVADKKFVELRCQSNATSGDNRLAYLRYDLSGAAGGGECLRAFTDLTAAVGTAHGAHVSLQAGATGYVSGLGAGFRGQLYIKDEAVAAGGTYYGMLAEAYAEGASSDISAVTAHAILGVIASGNATGVATVLNAMAFAGSTGTGKMIYNNNSTGAAESNGSIRILVDEGSGYVARYLRYWDAENS